MNQTDQDLWREEVLRHVLKAMAESAELTDALVFKGAWVLNYHLRTNRHSRDIDTNLSSRFVFLHPDVDDQREYLEHWIKTSVGDYFEDQPVVRFRLVGLAMTFHEHPMGWGSFDVRLQISDAAKAKVRGLPSVEIDIAAPEELSEISITSGALGSQLAQVYSLERIAGEKMRAYLSSLPTYCQKMKKPHSEIRVKDLYDLVRICREKNLSDAVFWTNAGREFERACRSRLVDCRGWTSFSERWNDVEMLFGSDSTLPKDVSFSDVSDLLPQIVLLWERLGVIPMYHEIT